MPSNRCLILSALAGISIAMLWSFHFVDSVIGDSVANFMLGHDAKSAPIAGTWAGAAFAIATGLAGTFTACNVCVISAAAPAASSKAHPLLWMTVGATTLAFLYGFAGVYLSSYLPQMQDTLVFGVIPSRLAQATAVFVSIGIIMTLWSLGAAQRIPNPFRNSVQRRPWLPHLALGLLIGAFLIGRPFPLFRKLFAYAVDVRDPIYGGLVFSLQSLGNMALVIVLALAIWRGGSGLRAWMQSRHASLTASAFMAGGCFLIAYWGVRIPMRFGLGIDPGIAW